MAHLVPGFFPPAICAIIRLGCHPLFSNVSHCLSKRGPLFPDGRFDALAFRLREGFIGVRDVMTYYSTIRSSPENQRFPFTNVSWLLDTRKDTMQTTLLFIYFLVCRVKGLSSNDHVGGARSTIFKERYGRELILKPAIEMLGGLP